MRSIEPPDPAFPWALPACADASPAPAVASAPAPQRRRHGLPAIAPADIAATVLWVVIALVVGSRLLDRLR